MKRIEQTLVLILIPVLLISLEGNCKMTFNKDLEINGTLSADKGDFGTLNIRESCNVDDLLSVDTVIANIVDTQKLYVDVIQSTISDRWITIQGSLVIEDPDEDEQQPSQYPTVQVKALIQGRNLAQVSKPSTLAQSKAKQLSNEQQDQLARQYSSGSNDWVLVRRDDFNNQEDVDSSGWSFTQTSYCQNTQDKFLGGHCLLGGDEVFKVYSNLPHHSRVLVKAQLHFLDDWQGESALVKIDSNVGWMKSVKASEYSVDLCGGNFKEAAFNVPVIIDTQHSNSSLRLSFQTTIKGDPCQKSLGIDNVEVYVK